MNRNKTLQEFSIGFGIIAGVISLVLLTAWVSKKLVASEHKDPSCDEYSRARPIREKIRGWQPVNWRVTLYTMDGRPVKDWHVKQSIISTESQGGNAYEWYFSITGTNGAQRAVRIPGGFPMVIEEE
jgi:hypothetical protein